MIEHPGQAVPDVAAGVVEAVVVVPLHRGALGAAVLEQVVDVASSARPARSARRCPTRAARARAGCGSRRSAAASGSGRPGWPSNWVRLWPPCRWTLSSPTAGGQPVVEGDLGAVPGGAPDRRAGEACRRRSTSGSARRAGSAPRPRGSGSRASRRAARAGSAADRGRAAAPRAAPARAVGGAGAARAQARRAAARPARRRPGRRGKLGAPGVAMLAASPSVASRPAAR